jgi:hypothetical protein
MLHESGETIISYQTNAFTRGTNSFISCYFNCTGSWKSLKDRPNVVMT